jgi:capsular exopolysaccharide synthesis family protein
MDSSNSPAAKFDPFVLLRQVFTYLKHLRLMAILFALGLLGGIGYFLYSTPLYQARSLVFFQAFGSPMRDADLPETAISTSRASRALMERLRSQEIQIAAAKSLGLLDDSNATLEALVDHVPAVRVAFIDARNLEVLVQAYDPDVVRNFCAALVAEFQKTQEAGWKEFRDDALDHYALQLTELEKKVAENVDSLTNMERDQQFTEVTIEQQNLLQIPKDLVETRERLKRMDGIKETLARYEAENQNGEKLVSILSLLSNFEKETEVEVGTVVRRSFSASRSAAAAKDVADVEVVTPSEVEGLEPWRDVERKKRQLEPQIEEAKAIYLPEHPKMKELLAEMDNLQRTLNTEMLVQREKFNLEYQRLNEKVAQLQDRIPEYQKITEELGRSSIQYSSIEQAQLMWDKARERLAEKLATVTFSEEFDWVQLRFKGHTSLRDKEPISPNKRKLVMLSLLLGLAGAIGIPTVLNLLDNSASSLSQLEDYIGLKGIGIVPLTDKEFIEEVHRSPAQGSKTPNFLLECFRVIRANIGLDSKFEGMASHVILVTSARPQEGKTTQSANLAWAYHSMGERVLLVDCDLRRGRQHVLLKLDNSQGMSHMLTGQISPRAAVLSTGQKDFDAIPRGPIIPGSTEMLCQEGFALLVQEWRTRYDRIILDCPPVLGLSESASLQRLADGLVLVVRSEKTSMKDVKDAVTLLRKTGAHFFGFVLNGVDLSKIGNYYQYYYYSAQYYDQFDGEPEEITGSLGGGPIVGVNTAPLPQPLPDPDLAPKPHSPSTIAPPAGAASQVTRRQPAQEAAKSGAAPVRQEPPAPGAVPAPVQTAHAKPIAPPLAGRPAAAGFSPEEPNRQQARAEQERRQLESEWSQVAERKPTRTPRPPSEPS